jgi:hypothetical protein
LDEAVFLPAPLADAEALVLLAAGDLDFDAEVFALAPAAAADLVEAFVARADLADDDFVPVVAPDLAGSLAIADLDLAGAVSGVSTAFAAEAAGFRLAEAPDFGLAAAFVAADDLEAFDVADLDAAAFGFAAAGVALPLAVAPDLAGSWAVADVDGVGSAISLALLPVLAFADLPEAAFAVVLRVVVLATSFLLREFRFLSPAVRGRKFNRRQETGFQPAVRHGFRHI